MDSDAWLEEQFAGTRALVIARGLGPRASLTLAERAWAVGVTMLEVPLQHPDDLVVLRIVATAARERGRVVGAGTIVDAAQVAVARDAGATFLVSPGYDEGIVGAGLAADLAVLPGVATASEIQRATRLGLHWLKAFPASVLGPEWFAAMRAPFPDVRFVATGGMSPENADDFLAAGAHAVAFGSGLGDHAQLARFV